MTSAAAPPGAPRDPLADLVDDPTFRERYELNERIGSGAYGSVWRAVRRSTGENVAVKILGLGDGAGARTREARLARLRHEVAVCERLLHPNVVRLVDSGGVAERLVWAAFAHVPGWNLADFVTLHGPLPRATALHLMAQVLDALATAHASGVIHRDVKPDNVIVRQGDDGPVAMVLDFGIGALAGATDRWGSPASAGGELLGTPAYAAPEQLRGETATAAADLYAWGLTTIEVLTGERVMAGATLQETIARQLSPDPVPIPAAITGVDLRLLLRDVCAKDVGRRAASATDVLRRLARVRAQEPAKVAALALPRATPPASPPVSSAAPSAPPQRAGVSTIPLVRNERFTGREPLLAEIASRLRADGVLAVCALKGLGGVGKTQLALEYAHRHRHEYDLVAWIRAEDAGTIDADLAALAAPLGLPEAGAPEDQRRIRAVRTWLETHDHWLLVLDNVVEPRSIRSYLPRNGAGHVLITSRHQSWHELARSVDVDVLSEDEAVALLLARSGSGDADAARTLASLLGRLPLALEEAAAYAQTTGRSLREYASLFREQQGRLLASSTPSADYPATLRTTWEMSLQRLSDEEPAAVDLLAILANLAPERVPRFLFLPPRRGGDTTVASPADDEAALDRQLAALLRYSLVRVERDEIFAHRLVQAVVRDRPSASERAARAEQALRLVERVFPKSGSAGRARPECTRLLPHAIAALGHARDLADAQLPSARLLRRTGVYLSACGWPDEAAEHLRRALSIFDDAGAAHETELAHAAEDLGMVLYQAGRLAEAGHALDLALATFEDGPYRDATKAAQALINRAWVHWSAGALDAAADDARRAVALLRESPGGELTAVGALAILSRVLFDRGDAAAARTTVDEVLGILSAVPGPYHPLLCGTLLQVSQVLTLQGRVGAALPLALEGAQAGERAYGRHHPLVTGLYSVLGQIHDLRCDDETAADHFARALEGAQAATQLVDPQVAAVACLAIPPLLRLGRLDEAKRLLAFAEELRHRLCGPREPFERDLQRARERVAHADGRITADE